MLGRTAGLKSVQLGAPPKRGDLHDVYLVGEIRDVVERRGLAAFEALDGPRPGCLWLATFDLFKGLRTSRDYRRVREELALRHACGRADNSTYLCASDPSDTLRSLVEGKGKYQVACVRPANPAAEALAREAMSDALGFAASLLREEAAKLRGPGAAVARRKAARLLEAARQAASSGAADIAASLAGPGLAEELREAYGALSAALGRG